MPKSRTVMKRLNTPMNEKELGDLTTDFIEYAAIHNIDVTTFDVNKRPVKGFVDQLGAWWGEYSDITDWNTAWPSVFFKSFAQGIRNITGKNASAIKGKVATRKVALEAEPSEEEEEDQPEQALIPTNPRKSSRAQAAKQDQAQIKQTASGALSIEAKPTQDSVPLAKAKTELVQEVMKQFPKAQKEFAEDAAALWLNWDKLLVNKRERKALIKERDQLMKKMQPVLVDPTYSSDEE